MSAAKSLWASIQGDPVFMRRVNGWLTLFWVAMIPISYDLGWLKSVAFVSALSLWALVAAAPERFFRPPYVGQRGWVGVLLNDGVDWEELAGIVEDAFCEVAPKRLVDELRSGLEDVKAG